MGRDFIMKFTKLTSAALVAATALTALAAPISTFAATPNGDATANGGQELPQTDTTDAAISFGDNNPNGNTGYLRLQMVPHILDFGNHAQFYAARPQFDATGANVGQKGNDTHASYDLADSNKTELLSTTDTGLTDVKGTAWTTVVDKQDSKQFTTGNPAVDGKNDAVPGSWELTVQSDDVLKDASGKAISDAVISFNNTKHGETANVYGLTNEDQDSDYTNTVAPKAAGTINNTIVLDTLGSKQAVKVATAAAGEGSGANVFGWNPKDIRLNLQGTTAVDNGEYHTPLTWTLNSTATA